jgi:outer membrane protein assembly factor BamB
VTKAGRVRWQAPLAGPMLGSRLSPLAVGAVAVFAQGDFLYGLRLADGHQVWSRAIGQPIAGMWRWQALVIVLTEGAAGGLPLLMGLDASTGQARWTESIAAGADGFYPTADGGLAILRVDGTLEVVELSSGRVRWTRPVGYPGLYPVPMAVSRGAVLLGRNGKLTSYDDRTGQIRWTDALMHVLLAPNLGLQAARGLLYLTGGVLHLAGGHWTPVLLGISAADGHVKWRFAPSPPETLWVYAPGLMAVTSSSGGTWQDELDPASGRVRWQVASLYDAVATRGGIVTGPGPGGTEQISMHDALTGQTRWIARLAGLNLEWQQAPALPVFLAGPLLVVPAAGRVGPDLLTAVRMSDGHRAWQVTIPDPVAAPPSAVPGGMLVYSADLRLLP